MSAAVLRDLIVPAGKRAGAETSLPVYSVTKHSGFVPSLEYFKKQVFSREVEGYKLVEPGDFAYATIHLDEGSIGIAPERGLISPMYTVFRADESRVLPSYLIRFLKSPLALARYPQLGNGAVHRRKAISLAALGTLPVPLPSVTEQRRIAAILDRADAIRAKRRQVLAHLDAIPMSLFDKAFHQDDPEVARLEDVALVSSGITKGRRTSESTTLTPYLAVANVQAGRLKLDTVKSIEATDAERERYALRSGDVVLTEGGDPDKLGRGTVWRGELQLCIHQNHIFRVRPDQSKVLPEYLAAFIASSQARSYFLRSAKQTTGIASINMTQLRALRVQVPPLNIQHVFLERVAAVTQARMKVERALKTDEELFASLQSRAFRGEL